MDPVPLLAPSFRAISMLLSCGYTLEPLGRSTISPPRSWITAAPPCQLFVPLYSIGIVGMLIENDFPPITGTQSGIVNPSLLMPEIAPFISPITALIGVLTNATRLSNTPLNIVFMPSHAFDQFPVNTPEINVMMPSKTVITPLMIEVMLFTAAEIAPPIVENATFTTGTITDITFCMIPAMKLNAVPTTALSAVITAPTVLQVLLTFSPKIPAMTLATVLTTFPIALNTVPNIVFNPFMMLPTLALMLLIFALNFFMSTPHFVSTFLIAFPSALKMLFTIFRFLKAFTAPFMVLPITLNGAFMMFTKPDNAPPAMVFSPFSAPFQSPVNTPLTN